MSSISPVASLESANHIDKFTSKTVASLAILNLNWESGNDYMDMYIPFVATLIKKMHYSDISIDVICKDFKEEYGLYIPYHPMQAILECARKCGLIKRSLSSGRFIPIREKMIELEFSSAAREQMVKQQRVIKQFCEFAEEKYKIILSEEDAESVFITFLKENSIDLFDNSGTSILPNVKHTLQTNQNKFLIYKFITDMYENESEMYKSIVNIAMGYILASAITYDEIDSYEGKLEGIDYYLDTRFIFRLFGLEGELREQAYVEFVQTLTDEKANLNIFQHTYQEITEILMDCEQWINDYRYDPSKASPVLKFFVEHQYSKTEIAFLIANFESRLKEYNINIVSAPDPDKDVPYQINEAQLYEIIVQTYKRGNPEFEESKRKYVIYKDVQSISAIYKYRKGKDPKKIDDVRSIFITTNSSLAYANRLFEINVRDNRYNIPACLTDVFIGTVVWLKLPAKISKLNEKKIIADCYAALQPNELLVKRFTHELERLNKKGKITKEECYLLKTYKTSMKLLEEKTMGDPNRFTELTVEEILNDIRSDIRVEEKEKYESEKKQLVSEIDILKSVNVDNEKAVNDLKKIENKMLKIARYISNAISYIIFGISILMMGFVLLLQTFPDLITLNKLSKIIFLIVGLICTFANLVFGFNIKGLRDHINKIIRAKIYTLLAKIIS